MQTKRQSLIESATQTAVAFLLATAIQPLVLHHEGCFIDYEASMRVAVVFTIVSFFRGYLVRRLFNWIWR